MWVSAYGNRIDHGLHGTDKAGLSQNEKKFGDAISRKRSRVHIFQDVDAVLGKEFRMNGENVGWIFCGEHFERPVIRSYRDDAKAGQLASAL